MKVSIDKNSGFCFGVANAIKKAEEILQQEKNLFCLGQMVHNDEEITRLESLGLITITIEEYKKLSNCKVLLRAHGEPPSTYRIAKENNIELIDATCSIVLNLQEKVKKSYEKQKTNNGKVVLYGKAEHPEIISLAGQCNNEAIIVKDKSELDKINFTKPISIFSQTTNNPNNYNNLTSEVKIRLAKNNQENNFEVSNSICGDVSRREPKINNFAKNKDTVIFVAGRKSSNGKMLFNQCKLINKNTYYITSVNELKLEWFINSNTIGICGATSTPVWLMEKVAKEVKSMSVPIGSGSGNVVDNR